MPRCQPISWMLRVSSIVSMPVCVRSAFAPPGVSLATAPILPLEPPFLLTPEICLSLHPSIPGTVFRFNSDQKVSLLYIDPHKDRIKLLGAVDFTSAVQSKGPSSCHGAAFNSYQEY